MDTEGMDLARRVHDSPVLQSTDSHAHRRLVLHRELFSIDVETILILRESDREIRLASLKLANERFPHLVVGLGGLRDALVGVGHRTRSRLVKGLQLKDLKSRHRNEFVNLTVQMAAAPDPLPYWCHPVLPGRSTAIRRAALFDEHAATALSENTLQLL
jgi:hypothetical protein